MFLCCTYIVGCDVHMMMMIMMMIQTTHYLVNAAHETLRQFSIPTSCRLLIPLVCYCQCCLDQLIGVRSSLIVSIWISVVLLVL